MKLTFKILQLSKDLLLSRSERFRVLIIGSFGMMVATVIGSLTRVGVVAILARYYSKEEFGMWTAITAITAIIITVDFGLGNALRNKISSLAVQGESSLLKAREYFLSVSYFLLILGVLLSIFLVIVVISGSIPIHYLFNTSDGVLQHAGAKIILISQLIIFLGLPFGLSAGALFSYQKAQWCVYLSVGQSVLYLLAVFILASIKASVVSIASFYFIINMLAGISATIILMSMLKWKPIRIDYRKVLSNVWELTPVGIRFFITTISIAFLSNVATIALSAYVGLADTAEYNLVVKLYMFGFAIYQGMLNPLWAGYADAVHRNDWLWCKKTLVTTLSMTIVCFCAAVAVMIFFGNNLLTVFAGKGYSSPTIIFILVGLWILESAIANCAAQVLNATGKLNIIIVLNFGLVAVTIPVMSFLCNKWGSFGIVMGNLLIALPGAVLIPVKAFSLISKGIRNKYRIESV